ncbi:2-hydroxyacid dehydrogenase [Limnohabitans sp. TS-CS-82]|uniref:2-hydroxyacid dehydrogenase n=1 Tax=Limnohabitans sp. TS-CS-82 TaxID=2094193 RepID=UPI000CF23C78|nr:2-hydroxyacid dehydrogenase [Limnohabitans sp. TS-CS-82]PQA83610.1 2-hydroxyacid dehydrogenase [Limnohabitans sp. TS-CS-82]
MSQIDVLSVTKLSPLLEPQLRAVFNLHDRLHETDPAAFAKIAPSIRAIAASGESKVPASLIEQLPKLEIISVFGVGYDGVDVAAAKARDVMVTHTPNVLNDDVADLAMGLMLAAARQLPAADRYVKDGKWPTGPMPLARKVSGARMGIVGIGRIGQAIAQRALAFNMSVAYTARSAKADLPFTYFATPEALAAESDYLVVITPGGAGTRKLINADVLKALGTKGILVNVARGTVVDEAALIEALQNGVIGGAGLDVFENEPNVPEALRAFPHVVLAPHIGSATTQTRQAMADLAFNNMKSHFDGHAVHTPVPECATKG